MAAVGLCSSAAHSKVCTAAKEPQHRAGGTPVLLHRSKPTFVRIPHKSRNQPATAQSELLCSVGEGNHILGAFCTAAGPTRALPSPTQPVLLLLVLLTSKHFTAINECPQNPCELSVPFFRWKHSRSKTLINLAKRRNGWMVPGAPRQGGS